MASDSDLASLIQTGHDITSLKLYAVSVTALWVYDYFITLEDEVRYAWKTERLFVFALFLITRYLPAVFQTWTLVSMLYPGYVTTEACQKSVFLNVVYLTCVTAAAQVVLAQRTYTIAGKNRWIAGILYGIFILQLGVAIYTIVWSATGPITQFPPIPLDAYRLCLPRALKILTVIQLSVSISFDVAVFALVIIQRRIIRSKYQGMSGPDILSRVSRDTEIYFGVIATSHFVVMILLAVAGIPPIPIVGNMVYVLMMISRMIMSLKKVASSRQAHRGMDIPGASPMNPQESYFPHWVESESIRLSTLKQ